MKAQPSFYSSFLPNQGNHLAWLTALGMLVGLFLLNWSPFGVILAYFLETIIIGIIHAVKLIFVIRFGNRQKAERNALPTEYQHVGVILFFLFHYFFFVAIQSIFIFAFFEQLDPGIKSAFRLAENFAYVLSKPDMVYAILMIAFFQISRSVRNFFLTGRYHTLTTQELFFQPYVRIFIQQFATILMGFFMFIPGASVFGAVLLIFIRLGVDLSFYALRNAPSGRERFVKVLNQKNQEKPIRADQLDIFLED